LQALKKQDAQKAKDACLKALKDRLIDRAHIIETRLEEEQAALTKRQVCLYIHTHTQVRKFFCLCVTFVYLCIIETRLEEEQAALTKRQGIYMHVCVYVYIHVHVCVRI